MFYAIFIEINLLWTSREFKVPTKLLIDHLQTLRECFHVIRSPFTIINTVIWKIPFDFIINTYIRKREYEFIRIFVNAWADIDNLLYKINDTYTAREHKRVETPYNGILSKFVWQFLECFDSFIKRRNALLKHLILIIVQSILNIAVNSFLLQFVKFTEKRFGVLAPKHYKPTVLITDIWILIVERISPYGISFIETVEEPIRIECWNIRASTRRYYQRRTCLYTLAALIFNFYVFPNSHRINLCFIYKLYCTKWISLWKNKKGWRFSSPSFIHYKK